MHTRVFEHLATHRGLLSTRDGLRLGLTERQLAGLVSRGELVRVHEGVYRHAAAPVDQLQHLMAGLLAVGPGGVVSHRSAFALHGARNFDCRLVELTHRTTSLPLRSGVLVHRSRMLTDVDIRLVDGLRVTSRERTLVDAAAVLPATFVVRQAEQWLAERAVVPDRIAAVIAAAGNHVGARRLRRGLAETVADADSVVEARLGQVLRRAGLSPELHVLVATASGAVYELDWAFPAQRVGLELDGYGVHLRSRQTFDDDRLRRNELELAGWRILNFTARHLSRPGRVVDQVRRALTLSTGPR